MAFTIFGSRDFLDRQRLRQHIVQMLNAQCIDLISIIIIMVSNVWTNIWKQKVCDTEPDQLW